jgi:hypothetical protein
MGTREHEDIFTANDILPIFARADEILQWTHNLLSTPAFDKCKKKYLGKWMNYNAQLPSPKDDPHPFIKELIGGMIKDGNVKFQKIIMAEFIKKYRGAKPSPFLAWDTEVVAQFGMFLHKHSTLSKTWKRFYKLAFSTMDTDDIFPFIFEFLGTRFHTDILLIGSRIAPTAECGEGKKGEGKPKAKKRRKPNYRRKAGVSLLNIVKATCEKNPDLTTGVAVAKKLDCDPSTLTHDKDVHRYLNGRFGTGRTRAGTRRAFFGNRVVKNGEQFDVSDRDLKR